MNKRKLKITIGNKLLFTLFTVIVVLLSVLYSLFLNNYFNKPANSIDFTSSEVQYVSANSSAVTSENLISDLFVMDVSAVSDCSHPVCYFIDETFHSPPTTCKGLTKTDCDKYEICSWTGGCTGKCDDSCLGTEEATCKKAKVCKWKTGDPGYCTAAGGPCRGKGTATDCDNAKGCVWDYSGGSCSYSCKCKGDCKSGHNCIQGAMIGNGCVESCSISVPIPAECDESVCWSTDPDTHCPPCTPQPNRCCSGVYSDGCTNCTPTCNSGYSKVNPYGGDYMEDGDCKPQDSICSGKNNCSGDCNLTGEKCYKIPTEEKAPTPEYVSICSPNQEACIKLSTDPSKPTLINAEELATNLYFMVDVANSSQFPTNSRGLLASYAVTGVGTSLTAVAGLDSEASEGTRLRYYSPNWSSINKTPGSIYTVTTQFAPLRQCTDSFFCTDGMCSNQLIGYFKINSKPTVTVSPNSGLSGSLPNYDNGTDCGDSNDNNPTNFEVTVTDNDGYDDILWAGLWIDETTSLGGDLKTSVHALAHKGTDIKIYAATLNSGTASQLANMEILIDGNLVKTIKSIERGQINSDGIFSGGGVYQYTHNTALRPNQITIRFPNDYYTTLPSGAVSGDRNLYIDSIKVNGQKFKINNNLYGTGSTTETLTSAIAVGNISMALYGLTYLNEFGNDTWNYDWELPSNTGMSAGSIGMIMSALSSASSNDDQHNSSEIWNPSESQDSSQNRWKLASTNCSGNTCTYVFTVGFGANMSEGVTNLLGFASDTATGPGQTTWNDKGDYRIDFTAPTSTIIGPTIVDKNTVSYQWSLTDTNSGVKSSIGLVGLFGSSYEPNEHTVTEVSAVPHVSVTVPYINPSTGSEDFNPVPIWTKGAVNSGTQQLNIGVINEGNLGVKIKATDNACNMGSFTDNNNNLAIGESWFATKGGLLYSAGDVESPTKVPDPAITYFADPYGSNSSNTQITTELGLINGSSIAQNVIRNNLYDPYTLVSYSNTSINYQQLLSQVNKEIASGTIDSYNLSVGSISGDVSNICLNESNACVINASGNLDVNAINCNRQALIKTNGNITINPDITKTDTPKINGCIFLAGGNISFEEGTYQSSGGVPSFDSLNGVFIAGGHIIFPRTDIGQVTVDGIKIQGAVYSLGGDSNGLLWQRSLQLLDNNSYPSFVVIYDPRYLYISSKFFGVDSDAYVKELGYKPY